MPDLLDSDELAERIRSTRIARGVSQRSVARALGLDPSAIVRLEQGARRVTATELFAIADHLDVPLADLVHLPDAAIVSRRTERVEDDADRAARSRFLLDTLLDRSLRDLRQLAELGLLEPVALPSLRAGDAESARGAARLLRTHLQLNGPLGALIDVAERTGLFTRAFRGIAAEGASVTIEPGFGVAVVSGKPEAGRRRFTVAHEIGHHVLGDEYSNDLSVAASRDERERTIDAFAAELLLPRDAVVAACTPACTRDVLIDVAATYRTSWSVVIDTATAADVITRAAAQRLRTPAPTHLDFMRVMGAPVSEDVAPDRPGSAWTKAVLAAHAAGSLARGRVVELLGSAVAESDLAPSEQAEP